jgi:hypothetical protein
MEKDERTNRSLLIFSISLEMEEKADGGIDGPDCMELQSMA